MVDVLVDYDALVERSLIPGESVVKRYKRVISGIRFEAVLTDRRLLFVRRNAAQDFHLNSISSLAWVSRPRWGLIAVGIALAAYALFDLYQFYSITPSYDGLFFLIGLALVVVGLFFKRHGMVIFATGRTFLFIANRQRFDSFIRDVRIQQSLHAGFVPTPPQPIESPMAPPPIIASLPVPISSAALPSASIGSPAPPHIPTAPLTPSDKAPQVDPGSPVAATASNAATAPHLVPSDISATQENLRGCPSCGAKADEGSAFCTSCGAALG